MRKITNESKPRQNKVRIFANGQYEERCSAIPVLEKISRNKTWNCLKNSKKTEDININEQRSFKNSFKRVSILK